MLLTEKQARGENNEGGVMCPMSAGKEKPFACRTSRCAAWRWAIWEDRWPVPPPDVPVGYCGMAGNVIIAVAFPRRRSRRERDT